MNLFTALLEISTRSQPDDSGKNLLCKIDIRELQTYEAVWEKEDSGRVVFSLTRAEKRVIVLGKVRTCTAQ